MMVLELKDIKTSKHSCSNLVILTIKFKVKRGCRSIYILDTMAERKIKDMFGFDVKFLECCGWADPFCKTIEKRILFKVGRVFDD